MVVDTVGYVCTTAPYLVDPYLLCVSGWLRGEENGTLPCRISSKDQYKIDIMNVAK